MIVIGEKINASVPVVGKAIDRRDAGFIRELARAQTDAGADYLDVCTAGRAEELLDLEWLIDIVQHESGLPLCIDSADVRVLIDGMRATGRPTGIVNAVSGDDDAMDALFPRIAETQWSCIAALRDSSGVPRTTAERMRIFHRVIAGARAHGIAPDRLFIDPLVCSVGVDGSCLPTFAECTRLIKREEPSVHVTSGLSNVSYGLPARKMVNMAFLALAMRTGMDSAIMDPTNPDLNGVLHATAALLGEDEFCLDYIEAYRDGLFDGRS